VAGLDVVVTVGMGPFPFDRLLEALDPVCRVHHVFAQTGPSMVEPPCAHRAFLPPSELQARLAAADVVVTHGGNTVRLVQRMGKVPIAVARRARYGEMPNDHQLAYLAAESERGLVVVLDDVTDLEGAVTRHPAVEARVLADRPRPPGVDREAIATTLDALILPIAGRTVVTTR